MYEIVLSIFTVFNKVDIQLNLFAEEEISFEDSPSEAVLTPLGTVEVKVAIVSDEMEKQKTQSFSPEVTQITNGCFLL